MEPTEIIKIEYQKRCRSNTRYSLRAFARHAGVSIGAMSEILSNKRTLTDKSIVKIEQNLGVVLRAPIPNSNPKLHQLNHDETAVVADWYNFGILSLMSLDSFQSCPKWIARKLNISVNLVQQSLERMQRLGLIKEEDGQLVKLTDTLNTTTDIPCEALRESHRQCLDLAKQSLTNDSISERDITGSTFALPKKHMILAKQMIREFRERLVHELDDPSAERIYNIGIQLYPISKED